MNAGKFIKLSNRIGLCVGWVVVHLLLTIYTMVMICIVVDEYFVPSLEIIANSEENSTLN